MTHGIPIDVTRQLEQAIKDAFTHDELWVSTRPMGDLHDEVTHANLSMEVVELVDWVEKRSRTPELLDCLLKSVPGNTSLQAARTRYLAAEEEAKKNPPADRSVVSSFADSRPTAPSHAGSKGSGGRFQAPPWAWMVLGALILIVLAFVFWVATTRPPTARHRCSTATVRRSISCTTNAIVAATLRATISSKRARSVRSTRTSAPRAADACRANPPIAAWQISVPSQQAASPESAGRSSESRRRHPAT